MRMKDRQPPICQYCNQPIRNFAISRHEPMCTDNPDVRKLLLYWLPNPDCPSRIRTMDDYKSMTPNSPGAEYLCNIYGGWHNVAAEFGLLVPPDWNEKRYKAKAIATVAELKRLSKEIYGGDWSPTYREYDIYRIPGLPGSGPMIAERLVKKYGTWEAVLEHYELPPLAPPQTRQPNRSEDRIFCSAPYWFDWREVDDGWSILVTRTNTPTFDG